MPSEPTSPEQAIVIGPVTLTQRAGQVYASHKALREPVQIDALQLQRWLLRHLREQVTVE